MEQLIGIMRGYEAMGTWLNFCKLAARIKMFQYKI